MNFKVKSLKKYFLSTLIVLFTFSFSYLPLNYFSVSKSFIMLSCLVLLSLTLIIGNQKLKEIFHNQQFLNYYLIFLGWYTFRLIGISQTQIEQVDFISIYIINTLTIFFCTNYSFLNKHITDILFFFGISYTAIFTASFLLITENQLFINIFEVINIQFDGSVYQNIGFWLSLAVIVSANYIELYLSKFKKSILSLLPFILIFIISLFFLLFIGSRGAFIGTLAALSFLVINTRVPTIHYLSLFFVIILIVLSLKNYDSLLTLNRLLTLTSSTDDSMRIYLFSNAIDLWLTDLKTFLFGGGVKSFPIFINQNSLGFYPHNIFLEVLSELGIVGIILFLKMLRIPYLNLRKNNLLFMIAVFIFFIFMVNGSLDSAYQLFFILALSIPSNTFIKNNKLWSKNYN